MSQNDPHLTGPEAELERAMGSLRPTSPALDRAAIAAQAVTRVMQRRLWRWRAACGALAALAVVVILGGPRRDRVVERLVFVPQPSLPQLQADAVVPALPLGSIQFGSDYQRLCQAVIDKGLDGLPRPAAAAHAIDLGIDPADLGPNARLRLRSAVP